MARRIRCTSSVRISEAGVFFPDHRPKVRETGPSEQLGRRLNMTFLSPVRASRARGWCPRRQIHPNGLGLAESTHRVAEKGSCDPNRDGLRGLRKVFGE